MNIFKRDAQKKEQNRLYKELYKATAAGKTDKVRELLEQGANPDLKGSTRPLYLAASRGYTAIAKMLIEKGAEVDHKTWMHNFTPLHAAAYNGYLEIAQALVAAGASKELKAGQYDAAGWAWRGGRVATFQFLKNGQLPQAEAQPKEVAAPVPAVEGEDEVTLTRKLGGRVLEETYNFRDRERITFVRKEEGGAIEAVTRDSFSTIDNKARLREAFALYAAKGGTIPEDEIFHGVLTKPKPAAGVHP